MTTIHKIIVTVLGWCGLELRAARELQIEVLETELLWTRLRVEEHEDIDEEVTDDG